jgi:hypothetical protein
VIDVLLRAKGGPVGGVPVPYRVVFTPLTEPTEHEVATTDKTRADAAAVWITQQVKSIDEVRGELGLEAGE